MISRTYSLAEISEIAQLLLPLVERHKIVLLEGEMGAGKTSLVQELLKSLGIKDPEGSPTYSIINNYKINERNIYHLDLFRLKNEQELFDIGFEELLDDSTALFFIEWPELANSFLPSTCLSITLNVIDENTRRLETKKVAF